MTPLTGHAETLTRLCAVPYLNAQPLVYGLTRQRLRALGLSLSFELPRLCARRLAQRQVHIGLIPAIEYARIDGLVIAPNLCIGASSEVRTVLLVSEVPLAHIERILLDYSSSSSAALVRILCRRKWGIQPEFVETEPGYEAYIGGRSAGLIIGDRAFDHLGRWPHVHDLAWEWVSWTGMPFVFALWAGYPEHLTFERALLLQSSLQEGLQNRARIARAWQREHGGALGQYLDYLENRVEYELDRSKLAGLRRFWELACEEGLIPAVPPLQFVSIASLVT